MTERPFEPSAEVGPFSGFIGAVCGAALCGSVAVALGLAWSGGISVDALIVAVFLFILAMIVSLFVVPLVALVIGLPFTCVLAELRLESAVAYTVGGAAFGLLPLLAGASSEWEMIIKGSFGVYGGTCGLLWWRLDRSTRVPVGR